MLCGSTATPSPKRATKRCAVNYGRIYCSTWPETWSPTDPTASSIVPSSAGQNRIHYSTNRADVLLKSPTAAAIGKDALAIIEALTKGHSGLTRSSVAVLNVEQ